MAETRHRLRKRKRVALIIETSNAYGRGVLAGISDFVREHEPWSLYLPEGRRGDKPPDWLASWDGDGIIARIENAEVASCVRDARLPAVDVSAARLLPDLPWVETDDEQIAELAFTHLHERGFKHFGFCGDPMFNWSRWRRDHFVKRATESGATCSLFEMGYQIPSGAAWNQQQEALAHWVRLLPRPTGVFACYDMVAQQLLDACRAIDVAVPEEIAVIGVDNDELFCNLSEPPLTSVVPDARRTGYEAASLLQRQMAGEVVKGVPCFTKPRGVETRQSTDILAISDRHVAEALRFIREHSCDGITVADVLDRSRVSRRVLESRFRKVVGRTPHEELLRARLTRVKVLLSETDLSIAQIAERTGYQHIEYLSAQFARVLGMPPSQYRQQMRTR